MRFRLIVCTIAAVLAQGCTLARDRVPRQGRPASSTGTVNRTVASDAERFRARLDSREHYMLPDKTELDRPFLCIVVADKNEYSGPDDDLASFRCPCANDEKEAPGSQERLEREYGITAATIADYKRLLMEAFVRSSPLLQKLLLHKQLKTINILVGGAVNGYSDGAVVKKREADGRPEYIFAFGLNDAAFGVDTTRGLGTFLGYFEAFQSLRGGLEHRAGTLIAKRRYELMPGGPSATISLLDEDKGRPILGPVGVILKILHHETGHCMLSLVDPPALAPDDIDGQGEYVWKATPIPAPYRTEQLQRDDDAPKLIFTLEPPSRVNKSYAFQSAEMNRIRDVLCFARGDVCGANRYAPGAPGFVNDFLAIYAASGLLSAVSTWRPDEALCEWESALQLEKYVQSWKVFPAPDKSNRFVDVIAEMRKFPRRADVVRYLEYRRSVLSAYLDDMDRPE